MTKRVPPARLAEMISALYRLRQERQGRAGRRLLRPAVTAVGELLRVEVVETGGLLRPAVAAASGGSRRSRRKD